MVVGMWLLFNLGASFLDQFSARQVVSSSGFYCIVDLFYQIKFCDYEHEASWLLFYHIRPIALEMTVSRSS